MNKEYRIVMYQAKIPYKDRLSIKDGCAFNAENYEYEFCTPPFNSLSQIRNFTYDGIYKPVCDHVGRVYIITEYVIEYRYVDDDGEWLDTIDYDPIYHYSFNENKDDIDIKR